MNKKFSTLAASLLFASAFTVNATVEKPVEGDLFRLQDKTAVTHFVGIGAQSTLIKGTAASYTPDDYGQDATYTDVFKGVNSQLWKIAKISKGTTGQPIYRFVNKQTGEYLAIKLETAPAVKAAKGQPSMSANAIILDPTGNKDWAIGIDGTLYAYTSADSTYSIKVDGDKLKLVAKEGTAPATGSLGIQFNDGVPALTLSAEAFNALMALPGNNAKLNFNNSKDVTDGQKNVVKDTKWVAWKFGTNTIALTDGTTNSNGTMNNVDTNSDGTVKSYAKKNFLQVDTIFLNADAQKYYALTVDTVAWEPDKQDAVTDAQWSATVNKPANKIGRHSKAAEFSATYFFTNDSIALRAKNTPKLLQVNATSSSVYGDLTEYGNYTSAYNKAVIACQENTALKSAITALNAAYEAFKLAGPDRTTGAAKPFSTFEHSGSNGAQLISAVTSALGGATVQAVSDYISLFEGLTYNAVTPTYHTAEAIQGYNEKYGALAAVTEDDSRAAISKLNNAYEKFLERENQTENDVTFLGFAKFVDSDGSINEETGTKSGQDLVTAVTSAVATDYSGNQTIIDLVAQYTDLFTAAFKAVGLTYEGNQVISLEGYSSKLTAAQAAAGVNQAALDAIEALNTAYKTFCELTWTNTEEGKTFNGYNFNGKTGAHLGTALTSANTWGKQDIANFVSGFDIVKFARATAHETSTQVNGKYFTNGADNLTMNDNVNAPLALRALSDIKVLTINTDNESGYIYPMVQPYATSGGDATGIETEAKVYNLQIKNEAKNYSSLTNSYLVAKSPTETTQVDEVDASNVYAQWAFIPGTAGYYSIVNRAIKEMVYYTGPVSKVKDADGKVVADTYVLGTDTLKIAGVTLNEDNFYTESKKQYDYSGTYYAGPGEGTSVYKTFAINPVSPFMSQLAAQFDKDSVLVLGDATEAPVWYMEKSSADVYGLEIDGLPRLKKQLYRIYTLNDDEKKLYVYATTDASPVYAVTLLGSKHVYLNGDGAVTGAAEFEFRNMAENQYQFISNEGAKKMTINATPSKPILEVSIASQEKNDLFMINKSENSIYRTLAEDLINGNVKIYMENEPNRYLYENTANIVANNGNKIAKDSLNFLGIYNTAALTKNAAIYVDTAYVNRKDNYMPQYMFALGVEEVEAQDAIACTYEHNHFDNAGNKVDAEHCSHATPATMGYKAGRYLVSLTDSIDGVSKHPGRYDGETRLAFVNAIHRNAEDALIIKDSKYTDTKNATKDTLTIADTKLNAATFALKIADQSTQSFYMETKAAGKTQWIRILNGVPVLTTKIEDAAIFNIEATTEEATANEAIEAAGVQVIGGQGVVTVQGAAGKVITVANILGQTIANQVAASDNVTIAAPAGVVVVAVEGDATKVVVK